MKMAKYVLGIPALTGNSDIITNYAAGEDDVEGLIVSLDYTGAVVLGEGNFIGVAQKTELNKSVSVAQGKGVPVIADDEIGASVIGKIVYATPEGKATDDDTDNFATLYKFSAIQTGGAVNSKGEAVVKYALIDTI
jgi:hypothetical protein